MCLADTKYSANDLLKQFKDSLIEGMHDYIPQKPISSKQRLPWVNKAIRKLIQARKKVYVKWQRSKSPRLREKLRTVRHKLQTQMRQAYWAYMERKAKWDDLKTRLTMCLADTKYSANDLLKQFKDSLIEGMHDYIPQKPISSKQRLPWVNKAIRKLIQARKKVYVKWQRSKSPRLREKLRTVRHKLQTQMRQAYWAYMETIIDFSSPRERPDDRATKQKWFWSFIRCLWKDSSGVSPLRSEGEIHSSAEKKAERLNQQFTSVFT